MGPETLRKIVTEVMQLLVNGQYLELEHLTKGKHLTATEIREAVLQIGTDLVMPPTEAIDAMDVYEGEEDDLVGIDTPMWTMSEGETDYFLRLQIIGTDSSYQVELGDIHVL